MSQPEPHAERIFKQILVVDDEPSVRRMLVRVLTEAGYGAWNAGDGDEAVRIANAIRFDLVLIDLGLPGKDGWETMEALTRRNPPPATVIITARPDQAARAQAAGAGALLEKPLDFTELLRTIERLLFRAPNPVS